MAKEVDLTRLKNRVVPQNPAAPQKQSKPDPSGMRAAPPQGSEPVNAMPMAPGQIAVGSSGRPALTDAEMAGLKAMGWKEGDPIPRQIPEDIQRAATAIAADADQVPDYSGVKMDIAETVDISSLPPSEQAAAMEKVAEASKALSEAGPTGPVSHLSDVLSQQPAATKEIDAPSIASQAIPNWKPPNQPDYQPTVPNPQAQQSQGIAPQFQPPPQEHSGQVEVDMPVRAEEPAPTQPQPQPAPQPQAAAPQPEPAPKPQAPPELEPDTGAEAPLANCPHCEWPLDQPQDAEPSYGEKQAFIQSVLGQKPFLKEYEMLGGQLRVQFRTLTTREVDTIYKQVGYEWEKQPGWSRVDYWERINRYRLYLQTMALRSADGQIAHELPDGLNEEANPNAEAYWRLPAPEDVRATALPAIEDYFLAEVFRSETVNRTVNNMCAQFNRLVGKLEGVIDNSDFWSRTEEQS